MRGTKSPKSTKFPVASILARLDELENRVDALEEEVDILQKCVSYNGLTDTCSLGGTDNTVLSASDDLHMDATNIIMESSGGDTTITSDNFINIESTLQGPDDGPGTDAVVITTSSPQANVKVDSSNSFVVSTGDDIFMTADSRIELKASNQILLESNNAAGAEVAIQLETTNGGNILADSDGGMRLESRTLFTAKSSENNISLETVAANTQIFLKAIGKVNMEGSGINAVFTGAGLSTIDFGTNNAFIKTQGSGKLQFESGGTVLMSGRAIQGTFTGGSPSFFNFGDNTATFSTGTSSRIDIKSGGDLVMSGRSLKGTFAGNDASKLEFTTNNFDINVMAGNLELTGTNTLNAKSDGIVTIESSRSFPTASPSSAKGAIILKTTGAEGNVEVDATNAFYVDTGDDIYMQTGSRVEITSANRMILRGNNDGTDSQAAIWVYAPNGGDIDLQSVSGGLNTF